MVNIDDIRTIAKYIRECIDEYLNNLTKVTMKYAYQEVRHLALKECIARGISKYLWEKHSTKSSYKFAVINHCFWLGIKHKDIELIVECINKLGGI